MHQKNFHETDTSPKLIQANLHNLGSLWQTASQPFGTYFEQEAIRFGYIAGAQWPNRIWTHQPLTPILLKSIKQVAYTNQAPLIFSHFRESLSNAEVPITNQGFELKSTQYGMSMPLQQPFSYKTPLTFTKVSNIAEAQQWSNAFKACFGYTISIETLQKSWKQIPYALIWYQKEVVGTVILYLTGQVAGIHSLGILPTKRGKGFATQAMYQVLNQAHDLGATLVTLQASTMAKKMYKEIGFTQQFTMENYLLENF